MPLSDITDRIWFCVPTAIHLTYPNQKQEVEQQVATSYHQKSIQKIMAQFTPSPQSSDRHVLSTGSRNSSCLPHGERCHAHKNSIDRNGPSTTSNSSPHQQQHSTWFPKWNHQAEEDKSDRYTIMVAGKQSAPKTFYCPLESWIYQFGRLLFKTPFSSTPRKKEKNFPLYKKQKMSHLQCCLARVSQYYILVCRKDSNQNTTNKWRIMFHNTTSSYVEKNQTKTPQISEEQCFKILHHRM